MVFILIQSSDDDDADDDDDDGEYSSDNKARLNTTCLRQWPCSLPYRPLKYSLMQQDWDTSRRNEEKKVVILTPCQRLAPTYSESLTDEGTTGKRERERGGGAEAHFLNR